ncbi:unnamed protein product [Musa banksii]
MESPPEDDFCSICHDNFTLPCQANCSHWFCGHCILRVWHHGSALQPCKCPICRRFITLLIPADAAVQERQDTGASQVLENIEKYNRKFGGGPSSIIQRLRDLPFFMRRLLRELIDTQRSLLPLVLRARIFFAMAVSAIYVLSPVDILPEGVFGFVGLLDDLIVLLVVILHLATIYRSVLVYRHGAQQFVSESSFTFYLSGSYPLQFPSLDVEILIVAAVLNIISNYHIIMGYNSQVAFILERMDISAVAEKEINCEAKCSHRCSKASRHKMCMRACIDCCHKCHCVPPGTYGHKEECPCYAHMKTRHGKPKCP